MIGLIGKKKESSQIFQDDGTVIPVTIVETGPCVVTQVKSIGNDGYTAVQLGVGMKKKIKKAIKGHLKKAKLDSVKFLCEFRVEDIEQYSVGQKIDVDIFSEGELIDVTGYSKGKGFQGVIKRHGFSGGPKTHGSTSHRVPGSVGASATPARVVKGKKLPGRMGGCRVTVKNLMIARIQKSKNIVMIEGAIPGSRNSTVILRKRNLGGAKR